jgi:hypothetical protein
MVWAVDLANQSMPTGYGSQADTGLSEKATNYTNQLTVNAQVGFSRILLLLQTADLEIIM